MKKSQLKRLIKTILEETISEGFQFHDFPEIGTGDGFNIPTDVKYGNTYIGTLVSEPNGYRVEYIDSPTGKQKIAKNPRGNLFKSKQEAAETLHKIWKHIRTQGIF